MRSVTVYPTLDQAKTVAVLDELSSQPPKPYYVHGCLYVDVVDDNAELLLFLGWEQEEIEAVERVVGHRPAWCVLMDLPWIVEAPDAARRLTLTLLQGGGAARDDYSSHPWTAAEIGENRRVEGRRFGYPD